MSDACRFLGMFSDGRNRTMVIRRGMLRDTDIGSWERRWLAMRPWFVSTVRPAEAFDMPFVCHVGEVAYVHFLYELFRKYRERKTGEEGFD